MLVIGDIEGCRAAVRQVKAAGRTLGFVPTMGALHRGHLSLMEAAKARCDEVAVSIFVNPTQFGPAEDFQAYPRPLRRDLELCERAGVWLVFTPTAEAMYPAGARTSIHVGELSDVLCGPFRPGHFDGVATVVAKLFHIVPADVAFFGEKDYQQLAIIRRMVADLSIPIEIIGCPTVREPSGLAMSSRNSYLSAAEREQAASISRGLFAAVERARHGIDDAAELTKIARDVVLAAAPAVIEYVELVDAQTLQPLPRLNRPARLCAAARIGATRLIDNVAVDPPRGPS
jgi:pantoate--beta-alanine ligase